MTIHALQLNQHVRQAAVDLNGDAVIDFAELEMRMRRTAEQSGESIEAFHEEIGDMLQTIAGREVEPQTARVTKQEWAEHKELFVTVSSLYHTTVDSKDEL